MTARARARLIYRQEILVGSGNPLALDEILPFNATLLQWHFRLSTLPLTDEAFTVVKFSPVSGNYNIGLASVNPFEDQIFEFIEACHWQFLVGDHLLVNYANTDDITVTFEGIFGGAD